MIPYTDTHCHLDFDRFEKDREQVLKRAWKAGLVWILNRVQTSIPTRLLSNSLKYPGRISAAVGIHPNFGKPWRTEILVRLREQAQEKGVVAIGEIGLDYYRQYNPLINSEKCLLTSSPWLKWLYR